MIEKLAYNTQIALDVIQSLWIGASLSVMERLSIESFLAAGHRYHLYCYHPIKNVPRGAICLDARQVLPESNIRDYQKGHYRHSYAAFANIFRFKLLYMSGGIWSDTDVVCLRPLAWRGGAWVSSERDKKGGVRINNTVLRANKGSEVMRWCFEKAQSDFPGKFRWRATGSDLVERYVKDNPDKVHVFEPEVFCPVDWWRWDQILKKPKLDRLFSQSHAVHLWNEMWRRQDSWPQKIRRTVFANQYHDKNTYHSAESWYGYWQNKYISEYRQPTI